MLVNQPLYFVNHGSVNLAYSINSSGKEIVFHSDDYNLLNIETKTWIVGAIMKRHELYDFENRRTLSPPPMIGVAVRDLPVYRNLREV